MPPSSTDPSVLPVRSALLTLGRLPVALEIARALHASGWRVVVAEPLAWHLCRVSNAVDRCRVVTAPSVDPDRYAGELLRIVDEEHVSLVVPVSEETPFVAALHARLPAGVALACPPRTALLALHDKWRFAVHARALGLAVPETALAASADGARLAASGAHVVKPRLSCSGVGVVLAAAGTPLPAALRSDAYVVQRRLTGAACCAFAFVRAGRVRTLVVYRSLLEAGSVSVTFERVETPDDVASFVGVIARERRHGGMLAFDFIADERGRHHAIECNPRATSGLHLLSPRAIVDGLLSGVPEHRAFEDEGDGLERRADDGGETNPFDDGALPVGTRRQEFWSAFAELEGRALRGRLDRQAWRRLFTTRDVDWSAADRAPFLLMVFASAPLLWRALRARRPITEVTMRDMGWHDAPPASGGT